MAKANRNRSASKQTIGGVAIEKLIGFTPQVVRNDYSVKEQRQLYSQLRHVAAARLERLKASGLPSDLARRYDNVFLKSAFVQDADLPFMLTELKTFLMQKRSTVSGLRQANARIVKTLQRAGMRNVNEDNIGDFGMFMEAFRSMHLDKGLYSSDAAQTLYDALLDKNISWKQVMRLGLKTFLEHAYDIADVDLPTGTRHSAANYRKVLEEMDDD